MNKTRLPQLSYFGLLFLLTACQAQELLLSTAILRPGDTIDGMILTTGSAAALPLWAFCSSTQENQHIAKTDCRVPPMISEVAIGHVFNIANEIPAKSDWSEFTWELFIDEQAIDLASFGTYNFSMPSMSPNPFPVREVFKAFTTWDVALTNLKPGTHQLHGLVRSQSDTYAWDVNLIIEGPYASDFGSTR